MATSLLKVKKPCAKSIDQLFILQTEFINGVMQKSQISTTSSLNDLKKDERLLPTNYKRGTGGRSSFSGQVATVFGATGIMGRILVNRLGKCGTFVVVPHRCDEMYARPLKLCGDLGQIVFMPLDLNNKETITNALKKSNLVINCLGNNHETRNFSFDKVHVDAARNIARACREAGVDKLIHFSALNASPNPQKIYMKDGSKWLRTKYAGEEAVKEEFPNAVIIRPSTIYGENDNFLMNYAHSLRRGFYGRVDLWKSGEKTIKMPVHQIDVANGIMKIVHNRDIYGKTFDFVGPNRYLLSDIVNFIMDTLRRPEVKAGPMTPYYWLFNQFYELMPKERQFCFELMEREFISDVTTPENPKLSELDIDFVNFADMVKWHLKYLKRYTYYDEKLGEFPEAAPPITLPDDFELHHH